MKKELIRTLEIYFVAAKTYLPSFWMTLGFVILTIAAWVLYQIGWHSPSTMQRYETAEICVVLKQHVCNEIGIFKFALANPCGNRDTRCEANENGTVVEVYGVTKKDDKERLITLASVELKKWRETKTLELEFYDNTIQKRLTETKLLRGE